MIIKRPVRNLSSNKPIPPRVLDVVIDGDKIDLEIKINKNKFERIPWYDVIYQVEVAKATKIK